MTSVCDYETRTVGDLVRERPGRARVFEDLGIDYCCGGRDSLSEACASAGLRVEDVSRRLRESDASQTGVTETDWTKEPLSRLVDHILETHHAYLRDELPRLADSIDRIVAAHAEGHPELREVRSVFTALKTELESHMAKEEQVLFPLIRELEQSEEAPGQAPEFHCDSLRNPIAVMESEHSDAGEALGRLRRLTAGFTTPEDGCATYRRVMDGLRELESDLHRHIHKENNILFPRAVELETTMASQ